MSLLESTFLVGDTETTGFDPEEHRAVEVAAVIVKAGQITVAFTTLLNPGRLIPAKVSAIHGLTDADVLDAPSLEATLPWLNGLAGRADAIAAHNAPFDRSMLPGFIEKPWLDTLRLSRHLFPDLDGHSNQAMKFHLGLRCPEAAGLSAHRALADAYVTARLLVRLLQEVEARGTFMEGCAIRPDSIPTTLPDLIAAVDAPMLLKTVGFGKHFGMPWAEVPKDYLQWSAKNLTDKDPDTLHTIHHYLETTR